MNISEEKMEKIVSLAKRRGFVFPGSQIYGGIAGMWDYGPYGVMIRDNVLNSWLKKFVKEREDMFIVDSSIVMSSLVLESSGHVGGFSDPLIECQVCKKRFRVDQIAEKTEGLENNWKFPESCPECKSKSPASWDRTDQKQIRQFNMMFKTNVGASQDEASVAYLRPETAQGIFVNFKNIIDTFHPKLPFGIAQIGKAFRNEIAPRDFLFRVRELEQMEIEYFVREEDWSKHFDYWRIQMIEWMKEIGLSDKNFHELEVAPEDRAHYSKRTIDFEYDFPFGRKELYGLAYRTDFDLKVHQESSGVSLEYFDDATGERFLPHVIEPSFGVGRTILALLCESYDEDNLGGEKRVVLRFAKDIAPIKIAVFPLLKNKPDLVFKAKEVFSLIKKDINNVLFDDNGNIGKRYRRQDEIGTPFCVTIDFQTLDDGTVTLRDRDNGEQKRVKIEEIKGEISN